MATPASATSQTSSAADPTPPSCPQREHAPESDRRARSHARTNTCSKSSSASLPATASPPPPPAQQNSQASLCPSSPPAAARHHQEHRRRPDVRSPVLCHPTGPSSRQSLAMTIHPDPDVEQKLHIFVNGLMQWPAARQQLSIRAHPKLLVCGRRARIVFQMSIERFVPGWVSMRFRSNCRRKISLKRSTGLRAIRTAAPIPRRPTFGRSDCLASPADIERSGTARHFTESSSADDCSAESNRSRNARLSSVKFDMFVLLCTGSNVVVAFPDVLMPRARCRRTRPRVHADPRIRHFANAT